MIDVGCYNVTYMLNRVYILGHSDHAKGFLVCVFFFHICGLYNEQGMYDGCERKSREGDGFAGGVDGMPRVHR